MLSDDERELVERFKRGKTAEGYPVDRLLAIIERVTSPGAVCEAFEKLAREKLPVHGAVHFGNDDNGVTVTRATEWTGSSNRCIAQAATLAEAMGKLKGGG